MPAIDSKQIFVTCVSQDEALALRLGDELKLSGVAAYLDIVPASPDDEPDADIVEQISILLVIVSAESLLSAGVKQRWKTASEQFIPVIVILVENVQLPSEYQSLFYFSLDFQHEWEKERTELLDILLNYGEVIPPSQEIVSIQNAATVEIEFTDDVQALRFAEQLRQQGNRDQAINEYLRVLKAGRTTDIQKTAVRALGELHAQDEIITDILNDDSPEVRTEAALALARIGGANAKSALQVTMIQDKSVSVRLNAAMGFMLLDNRNKVLSWLNDLASASTSSAMKEAISLALLRINELLAGAPQHVFISYARHDSEHFTVNLAETLRKTGFSVWIDINLEPGTTVWIHEIEKAIQQAGICVVVLSPAVHESEWVGKEVLFARQFNKPIIPIKYIETHKPLYLSTEQGLRNDLPFDEYPDEMLTSLIDALDKLIARTR